jgi:hypothetical protein
MANKRRKCAESEHQGFTARRDVIDRLICKGCDSHIYVPGKGFVYVNNRDEMYFSES